MLVIFAPELIISIAVAQLLEARRTVAAFNKLQLAASSNASNDDVKSVLSFVTAAENDTTEESQENMSDSIELAPLHSPVAGGSGPRLIRNGPFDTPWTLATGFLSVMGGLVVEFDGDGGRETSILLEDDAARLAASGHAVFPKLDHKHIKDKSKADSFAKAFALIQCTWFVFNVIVRSAKHFPITPLEILTIGYTFCATIVHGIWWSKLKDVMVPMVIMLAPGHKLEDYVEPAPVYSGLFIAEERKRRHKRRENWEEDQFSVLSCLVMAGFTIAFGAVHTAALNFEFISVNDTIGWRVFALVASLTVPVGLAYNWVCLLLERCDRWLLEHIEWRKTPAGVCICPMLVYSPMLCLGTAYLMSRLVLIFLSSKTMESLPSGYYITVDWLAALPHF